MSQIPMQYFNLAEENYSKYGLSVIQLIQIGKFYELWHEPDTRSKQQAYFQAELLVESSMRSGPLGATPPIEQVASSLDMRITSPGKRSLLQMGFPIYSLTTHLSTLLDKGWTVIVIDELVTGKSGPKQRAVSQVYSPSCNLEDCSELSYVLSIYFSQDDLLGITLFSAMSGHSIMFPVSWTDRDKVARLLISYRVREIVIWVNLGVGLDILTNKIYNLLIDWNLFPSEPNAKIEVMGETLTNLPCYLSYRYENNNKEWLLLHVYVGINAEWFNKNYQKYTLSKIFQSTWTENVNQVNLISLLGVLHFINDRNPDLIKNLQLPECYNSAVSPLNLILCNRAEYQLDLLPKGGKLGGLLSLVDYCSTAMGKRLLKFRLLNPITDYYELNLRYEEIATFKQLIDKKIFDNFELKHIKDLSSLHRQWAICASSDTALPPKKLSKIYHSYLFASQLISKLTNNKWINVQLPPSVGPQLESLIEEIGRVFQVDSLLGDFKYVLRPTDNLTNLLAQQQILRAQLTEWAEQTSNIVFQDTISIKAEYFNKEGYAFAISYKKLVKLEHYMTNAPMSDNPIIVLGKRGSSLIITSSTIQKVSIKLSLLEEQINTYVKQTYNRELKRLYFSYSDLFLPLVNMISRLDVALSGAIAAIKFNYTKPCLTKHQQTRGLIEAINLRHPLVEQLNTQEECVAHNISLEDKGMLIFSVNGAGKSTLLRTIGVNVILAQAGMYVAADSFRLRPYHYLITRILGGDDLHKGQGTFEVEMRDLSTILKLANYNSLILGDEICHGTEVSSGTAILAATIERLTAAQTSFVLSTHLHQVFSLIDSPVRCYHLSVMQQKDLGLIYERKLKPGPGPSQYGIEVMGHIINDKKFYNSALKYRKLINWEPPSRSGLSSLAVFRPSKYNAQVFIDSCEICGAPAEAIHHIQPEKLCNRRSNLVPVCSSCHLDIHRNKISILGWKRTPGHRKLYWVYLNESLDSGTE
ncbi:DNA mismatch repair protein (mitochondrion) [Dendronephthya gigantea]|uniref:MutS-like protein n=4 Tax=Dendronephthya TaxID=51109 RepID=G8DLT6_DENML|nr:DNA mismatch repair protein [Dendronephthya gigantea]YP_007516944.1 MutS-like protein [Dendronephthya mollis]YP_008999661.1 DNA mismatch repair protein [Dendronephthya castanea]ACZ34402.1 DNA mismatch repair protein [Dendronephthya suensoni]UFI49076.1 MutS-like protein [Dendronephthya alba]ACI95031.1 DNA mismatch repair protein [Dendronephthya gigantea]ACZ34388.1 DNA mismatch repair protein [Dendronephthya castanea]ADY15422.1 MutS-like protein [Dendronephthya mollis]